MSKEDVGETLFEQFVRNYGHHEIASRLEVHPTAVLHWVSGANSPHPANAIRIQVIAEEAGTPMSLDQIYQHFRQVRTQRFLPDDLQVLPRELTKQSDDVPATA